MWKEEKIKAFRRTLLDWYDANKRDLPWRKDRDPYHVLVSELMLQQTQVQTVIPYYQRFIAQFPTVAALAAAPEAKVMKAWEGLGYYSRARNLQKAAKQLMVEHGGQWPHTATALQELAGIGPYTAGAIASIAFDQVEPAIDGNAFRVFARLFCVPDDIAQPKTRAVFDQLIRQVIDPKRPGDFNQAIMDLGSSYMAAKDPDPAHSPVAEFDESWQTGRVMDFPVKTKKKRPRPVLYYALAVHSPKGYLFVQRPSSGMLANLWMFPLVAREELEPDNLAAATVVFAARAGHQVAFADPELPVVKHTFTHQQWQLTLLTAECPAFALDYLPGRWVPVADLATIAIPTVQKKLLQGVQE
ncbi:MAG: A/G-specific adenine glycosylase [Lactobacillus sp.]|jgi:A/G-specific adenine glycosylase|nr:A/G-specific adenine glycosylase [Lactobacillus sp.]MCI2033269.1 A/G-specific adenine glycosylase [Lactobacillus sp.]